LVLMVLSYTSCISLFKKSLRPYGYWWSEVDNQIKEYLEPFPKETRNSPDKGLGAKAASV